MLNKIDADLSFVNTALNLRSRRQEILASNLANSDTPNYKARDVDFSAALQGALGASGGKLVLARTAAGHLPATSAAANLDGAVVYRQPLQPSLDGNTVDPDVERAHFAENTLHYQFLLERANSKIQRMKQALTGER
jgi:flagellar basal-body rod protein FlgB